MITHLAKNGFKDIKLVEFSLQSVIKIDVYENIKLYSSKKDLWAVIKMTVNNVIVLKSR